jgi:hypothetical protein
MCLVQRLHVDTLFMYNKPDYRPVFLKMIHRTKASGAFTRMKPQTLQRTEVKRCAELASADAITILYGRIIACIKSLYGTRGSHFTEWQWRHISFCPVPMVPEDWRTRDPGEGLPVRTPPLVLCACGY